MRALFLTTAVILNLLLASAAKADIAPDPVPPTPPSDTLAIAGGALALGVVSLGLWFRKRSSRRESRP